MLVCVSGSECECELGTEGQEILDRLTWIILTMWLKRIKGQIGLIQVCAYRISNIHGAFFFSVH